LLTRNAIEYARICGKTCGLVIPHLPFVSITGQTSTVELRLRCTIKAQQMIVQRVSQDTKPLVIAKSHRPSNPALTIYPSMESISAY
jgi:hypothetical protein